MPPQPVSLTDWKTQVVGRVQVSAELLVSLTVTVWPGAAAGGMTSTSI